MKALPQQKVLSFGLAQIKLDLLLSKALITEHNERRRNLLFCWT